MTHRIYSYLSLVLILLIANNINLQAQTHTRTPYEQKVSSLYKQFLMDIGIDYKTAEKASLDSNYFRSITPTMNQKMESGNQLYVVGLTNELHRNLEDAKKLMNAQEKERDRQKILALKKVEDDKRKQEEYRISDANNLKISIREKYKKWIAKGEFEKTTDYQDRMNNKQQAVRDIIITSFQECISIIKDKMRIECYLDEYNPEKEFYLVAFFYKNENLWYGAIKLSPDKAKQLKSSAREVFIAPSHPLYYSSTIEVVQDNCNIRFYNNNLIPTTIGVRLKVRDGNGKTHYEMPELILTTTPDSTNLGKDFFTTKNLEIDLSGNENLTLNDINLACKQMADAEANETQELENVNRMRINSRKKFDSLIISGNSAQSTGQKPQKVLEYYKQALNIYDEKTLDYLYSSTSPYAFLRKNVERDLKILKEKIKQIEATL